MKEQQCNKNINQTNKQNREICESIFYQHIINLMPKHTLLSILLTFKSIRSALFQTPNPLHTLPPTQHVANLRQTSATSRSLGNSQCDTITTNITLRRLQISITVVAAPRASGASGFLPATVSLNPLLALRT